MTNREIIKEILNKRHIKPSSIYKKLEMSRGAFHNLMNSEGNIIFSKFEYFIHELDLKVYARKSKYKVLLFPVDRVGIVSIMMEEEFLDEKDICEIMHLTLRRLRQVEKWNNLTTDKYLNLLDKLGYKMVVDDGEEEYEVTSE